MKLQDWIESGELEGYEQGTPIPGHNALVDGTAIDKEVAEETRCQNCGGSCEYRPYVTKDNSSYRAFAVCKQCGEALEF